LQANGDVCFQLVAPKCGSSVFGQSWAPMDIQVLNAFFELPEDFRAIIREPFDRQIAVKASRAGADATLWR
jgi:hypothetical protein